MAESEEAAEVGIQDKWACGVALLKSITLALALCGTILRWICCLVISVWHNVNR